MQTIFFFLPGGRRHSGRLCRGWFVHSDRSSFSVGSLHVNGYQQGTSPNHSVLHIITQLKYQHCLRLCLLYNMN